MLWLLIGVIDTCEVLDFTLVGELVETFHIALATHFDRAIDVDLDEIADLATCPLAHFTVGRNSRRNTYHTVSCQQAAYKGNTLDVGIAVFTTKAKPFAQMCAHYIPIEYFNLHTVLLETDRKSTRLNSSHTVISYA